LKKSSIPLSEINSNSGPELVALRRLAEYFNNVEKRFDFIKIAFTCPFFLSKFFPINVQNGQTPFFLPNSSVFCQEVTMVG